MGGQCGISSVYLFQTGIWHLHCPGCCKGLFFPSQSSAPTIPSQAGSSKQGTAHGRAAAHGKENADLRKIPGALSLRPILPILFLILEAGGVAGVDQTGPVPVFISMEAAHRLAQSLLPTPPGLGSTGGTPAAPRVQGLIIHILISTHIVMGVINGCGSIQAGWGCAASLPSHTPGWGTSLGDAELSETLQELKDAMSIPRRVPAGAKSLFQ